MRTHPRNSDQTIDVRALCRWAIRAAFGITLLWLWHLAVAGTADEMAAGTPKLEGDPAGAVTRDR